MREAMGAGGKTSKFAQPDMEVIKARLAAKQKEMGFVERTETDDSWISA